MVLQILLFAFLAIMVGLVFTFSGYALFRIIFPIWGFFAGFWAGGAIATSLIGVGFMATSFGLIIGFFIGLVFAVLAYSVYELAMVIFGASTGFAIGQGFMFLIGFNAGIWTWMAGFILAVVFALAFMTYKFPKMFLMVATAFAGSSAIIAGFLALFGQVDPGKIGLAQASATIHSSWFWWIVWFVLAMFGATVQSAINQMTSIEGKYNYDAYMADMEKMQKEKAKAAK